MNNRIISLCVLAICSGCKVNKEKSERIHTDSQSQGSMQTSTAWKQFNSHDSSYRYWYYTGDSSFFFHPDLGLWSRSGQITYAEQRAVKEQVLATTQHYDSLGAESNQAQSLTHSQKYSYPLLSWLGLLLIIPIAGLIYRLRK